MKKLLLPMAVLVIAVGAQAQTKKTVVKKPAVKTVPTALKTNVDSLSYAIGVNVMSYFKTQGIKNISKAALNKAIDDVLQDKTLALNEQQAMSTIQQKLQSFMQEKIQVVKEEGKKFLVENKKRSGVVELPDGLQYEVVAQGSGPKPAATDSVTVHYTGTLLSGKKFDSSVDRGQPATFPLNRVIKGWTEGVQLMSVGSKYKFYIPSDLAYGDRGAGSDIPGGSTLIFEVELLSIGK